MSNKLSSLVIPVPPPLNNSIINPPYLSLVCQKSSISSQKITRDKRCFNSKDSNLKINELSLPVIPVPHPLNDSIINPPLPSSVFNSHPDLHITQHQSRKIIQYLVRLHLISQIQYHRRIPRMEVAVFMDAWLMCLS